ncbi:MAG TPA: carbohydrate-binding protein [Polyangiaceae bacterium]|nr:carbohydrate-binding protein [Polyangiaceae bacterium]
MIQTRSLLAAVFLLSSAAACAAGSVGESPEDVEVLAEPLLSTRVEAEAYNRYSDTTTGNTGGGCVRGSDSVDMQTTTDTAGGTCNVGWTAAGEWLEYDVNLPTSGSHSLTLRVASASAGQKGKVLIDNVNIGTFEAPASGWQSYADRTFSNLNLNAGKRVVRVVFDTGSINLNYLDFKGPDATSSARDIANNLEAESHDGMSGLQYESCSEGGQNAGWIDNSDWVEWKVNVPATGSYSLTTRSASTASASYAVLVDGTQVTTQNITNTGGWQNWQSFTTSSFNMNAGTRTLRIKFTSGSQNLNYAKLQASTSTITWRSANLTWFTSYPDPGSEECLEYNGCTWAGQFAALSGTQPIEWVQANNIAAVHSKDFAAYKLKTLRIRQGSKQIDAKVYDMCSDSDCSGCCTANSSSTGFLIDLESFTKERFGSGSGTVEWYCLDC